MAVLSNYGPHTAAKHRILRRYLEAWLPIMAGARGPSGQREPALVVVDGFSGAGRYDTGEKGSPLVMLDAYLKHSRRKQIEQPVHFIFIEKEKKFISHLEGEVSAKPLAGSKAFVQFRHGLFADQFPEVIGQLKERYDQMPATFAFIDPFGLKDNSLELTSGLAVQERCEVLVYLPTGFMARFESTDEFAQPLDHLYGSRDAWVHANEIEEIEQRRAWMRDRFAEVLSAQTNGTCLAFDIQPRGSSNIYSLIFSSQARRGIQQMKEAMWKVDPVSGQFFRGGLRPKQAMSLFDEVGSSDDEIFATYAPDEEPDFEDLQRQLLDHFGAKPFRIEDAADFTLYKTVFRDNAHLKRQALRQLEKDGTLEVIKSPRTRNRPGDYPPGTILRFVQ